MDTASLIENQRQNAALEASSASAWVSELCEGSHQFSVMKYSIAKGIGVGNYISSDKFDVGDCSWQIRFWPDGENDDVSDHVSVFITLAAGEPGTRASFRVYLVDQSAEKKHMVFQSQKANAFQPSNSTWGWPKFMKRDDLEASRFLKDDCLLIRCTVGVVQTGKTITTNPLATKSITLPASDLGVHLRSLFEIGVGADVRFDVNGELFSAHKALLAARSSVFKAQFFGSLRDESVDPIKIQGMEASVFKILLHFMYCDVVPNLDEFKAMASISLYQHLLAAADQYDLNRLKLLCATYLGENISIDTAASTWALAERHHCSPLKASCIEFIASLKNPQGLMQTSDFKEMKEGDPSLMLDFIQSVWCYERKITP